MIDMEVKATDSIKWAELTRQLAQRDDLPSAAPARLRQLFLAAIQSGALAPGARLKEIELVNALSVSRTPLREALAALRAEGILERDDDGLRVRRLGWRDVRSLYELRGTLEAMAAQLAAENATKPERQVIGSICEAEVALIADGAAPQTLARHNRQFHHAILQAAGNRFLSESLEKLSRLMVLLGATAYSLPERATAIRTEHEAINEAIQLRDTEAASNAMRAHLEAALRARLELLSLTASTELD
jgi:DNA-binding GntR family transcriptional regulator